MTGCLLRNALNHQSFPMPPFKGGIFFEHDGTFSRLIFQAASDSVICHDGHAAFCRYDTIFLPVVQYLRLRHDGERPQTPGQGILATIFGS
ncbi:hypothetical protein ACU81Q_02945 [Komagataeibacter melomenusus]